jgi:hypothetical protein
MSRLVVLANSVLGAVVVGVIYRSVSDIAVFGSECYTFWHLQANVWVFT